MMMASTYGRLGNDPKQLETKTGKTMATASIAVDVTGSTDNQETLWLKILAFNKVADQLLRHSKGDLLSTSGKIQQNRWSKDGVERTDLQMIADTIISARTVRPAGRKKTEPSDTPVDSTIGF